MFKRNILELTSRQVGDNIAVPIPLVDRGRNILGIIIDCDENNMYAICVKAVILKGKIIYTITLICAPIIYLLLLMQTWSFQSFCITHNDWFHILTNIYTYEQNKFFLSISSSTFISHIFHGSIMIYHNISLHGSVQLFNFIFILFFIPQQKYEKL